MTATSPQVSAPAIDPATAAQAGASVEKLVVTAPVAHGDEQAGDVRLRLHGTRHESIAHIALVHGERLVGLVRATDLMAADPHTAMTDLVMHDPPVVSIHASRDEAAWAAVGRGESEVVVVDDEHHLVGVITAPQVLALVVREHEDDLARLSGYLHQGDSARRASNETVYRRFLHRLPWLLIGLVGAVIASTLVSGFEEHLNAVVALAFFMPAVVYLAAAVGEQTVTLAVRGLSLGVSIRKMAVRDLITGVLLGTILGLAFTVPAYWLAGEWDVAIAVSTALFVACSTANITALGVPWCVSRMGLDPAFGSGPLATVIQDVLSIAIYFAVASIMLGL